MPTDFQSYDLNKDGQIGQDEWQQFYALDQGPASQQPVPAEFDLQDFIGKVQAGTFTDDDMLAFSNWYMGQQLGLQAGQMDYQNRTLGLNEQQLDQQYAEFEFMRDQYFPWYTGDFFDFQKQMEENKLTMSNNQVEIAGIEKGKAQDYALAQFYNTEQAKLGSDAARYNYLTQIQQMNAPRSSAPRSGDRSARTALGMY